MRSLTRNARINAAVPCPRCKAGVGQWCCNPAYGPDSNKPQPVAPHHERRMAWLEWKRSKGL